MASVGCHVMGAHAGAELESFGSVRPSVDASRYGFACLP